MKYKLEDYSNSHAVRNGIDSMDEEFLAFLKRVFEHELLISSIPYKVIFEIDPFRGYLFDQFCKAKQKPCLWLYHEQHCSQEDSENTLVEIDQRIPMSAKMGAIVPFVYPTKAEIQLRCIASEFMQKQADSILEAQFFCPDILSTPIVLALSEIYQAYNYFQKSDPSNEPKHDFFLSIILSSLKSINHDDLRQRIIKELIDDDLNTNVWSGGLQDEAWREMKFKFNYLLSQQATLLSQDEQTTTHNHPQQNDPFSSYFRCENPDELIKQLKERFPSGKSKEGAIMVFALYKCDIISFPTIKAELKRAINAEWKLEDKRDETFNRELRKYLLFKKEEEYPGEINAAIKFIRSLKAAY